jgi:hypothetical protein
MDLPKQNKNGEASVFEGFDLTDFWKKSDYADREYVSEPLTPDLLASVEQALKYKLPASYVALMQTQNGGIPKRTNHRTTESTTWAEDHIAITGIYGIAHVKTCSLCGDVGSQFWTDEWGYPPIGVYFADCPSAGHDMVCLDYRECGPAGEPKVVHVDQGSDYKITFVADNFESFIRRLEDDGAFEAT